MWQNSSQLIEIANDVLTVGKSIADLGSELQDNTWLISMSVSERRFLAEDDLVDFFHHVIKNREQQLKSKVVGHGMYFYMWHDRQASQLRFSLISDFHNELPFGCKIIQSDLNPIVREFLNSDDEILYSELNITDATQENLWNIMMKSSPSRYTRNTLHPRKL